MTIGSDQPKTLLQMAGAPDTPAALSEAALVLIDCQREYVDGPLRLTGIEAALTSINALLARARRAGSPIVHVVHKGRPGGLFDLDDSRGQIANECVPVDGEMRVEKGLPNAFAGTELDNLLKDTGRSKLIVAGFMTHMCVSSTVRAGLDLGYASSVLGSGTATRDLPGPAGGATMKAEILQAASLAALSDRFAIIAKDVDEIPD